MTVSFSLPAQVEKGLRERYGDVSEAAREAVLLELYRREEISNRELGEALGLDRQGTQALLKRRGIYDQTKTPAELEDDYRTLERVLGPAR